MKKVVIIINMMVREFLSELSIVAFNVRCVSPACLLTYSSLVQQLHVFPFAFSKASLPSEIEKYASPAAPIASAQANPVSS